VVVPIDEDVCTVDIAVDNLLSVQVKESLAYFAELCK
jgi:hypothetical protein